MNRAFLILLFIMFAALPKAQINPYSLTRQQVDSFHAVQAQTRNDSLKMEIDALFSIYYSDNNRDSSIYFLNQQLALATKLKIYSWQAEALSYLSLQYTNTANYSKALQVLNAARQMAGGNMFTVNTYPPKFITGIPDWLTNRQCLLSIIQFNEGLLYGSTGNVDKEAACYAAAIRMAEKINDKESLFLYTMDLGTTYINKNKQDSALMLLQKALAYSKGTPWQYYTGFIYRFMGRAYYALGKYPEALHYYRMGADTSHQQHNISMEGYCYNTMANTYLTIKQPDSAIAYSRKAAAIFNMVKYPFAKANMYINFSLAFQQKGNIDSAFAYLWLCKDLSDSINGADRAQAEQYQLMTFNEQLKIQEAESERNRQKSRMIIYATLAGLAVSFLIAFLLYRNNRQKQKTNSALAAVRDLQDKKIHQLDEAVTKRTEQLNSFRQAMATDFHDQTGNMLSAITRQATMLKLKLNNNADVLPVVESIITNSNELYDSSKDFLWNLNHNSDDPLEVFNYLTAYGQVFYNQFNIAFSSLVKGDMQHLQPLEPFAALNLIYIFKEGMTNVVKHANAGEVFIEMEAAKDKVVFALQDDGLWKPKDESQSHYGLSNIEKRCAKNNFGYTLLRRPQGTRIEISIQVKNDFDK